MKIKVGISSCLLGQSVRYDGGHKHSTLCTETLSDYFEFVSECPEVGIGLGIPRKPIHLIGDLENPHAVAVHDHSIDYTQQLHDYGIEKAQQLSDISGYIFMKNSPSCGLFRIKVYQDNGHAKPKGSRGIYAHAITQAHPLLPVEENGRLEDPGLRENFIIRVFAYANWQQLVKNGISHQAISDFHACYKYCLMAHDPQQYSALGRLIANTKKTDAASLADNYFQQLMTVLSKQATRKTHSNVLMHLQGYLKHALSADEKQELVKLIDQYRLGHIPLIVPITMLKHHFANHPDPYIAQQAYLQPYPDKLGLRNTI